MMAGNKQRKETDDCQCLGVDTPSNGPHRIHGRRQLQHISVHAAEESTLGDQRQQHAWLKLREHNNGPADPIRWLPFQSQGISTLIGRVTEDD